jgi:hypothetical protein
MFDTGSDEGRRLRKEQLERKKMIALMRNWKKTKRLAIANILMAVYGLDGDFDISPDGDFNR